MSIKNFLDEIARGLLSPVYLLYSDTQYLLDEAVSAVRKTVSEAEIDFNFNIFDLDSGDNPPTPEQIITTLNTIPFFGKRRYVFVRNPQKLPAKDLRNFQDYSIRPSPDSVLILLHIGILKKELKENLKGIKAISLDIRAQDLPLWIKEKARQKGLDIRDNAVEYLLDTVGSDIGLLSSELEKLTMFGSAVVDINSIRQIVEGSREYSVFDLTDALRAKDTERVFKIHKVLAETIEPYILLGAINWQYSKMMQSKEKARSDYFRRAFELLNDADIKIKTSSGVYPMEHLLIRLLKL